MYMGGGGGGGKAGHTALLSFHGIQRHSLHYLSCHYYCHYHCRCYSMTRCKEDKECAASDMLARLSLYSTDSGSVLLSFFTPTSSLRGLRTFCEERPLRGVAPHNSVTMS